MGNQKAIPLRQAQERDEGMDQLSLRIYPDAILREFCVPVEGFDSTLMDLQQEMLKLMRMNNGIGLAAPQVGIKQRLVVCEMVGYSLCLVNPMLHNSTGFRQSIEGCLSLPGVEVSVSRSRFTRVSAYDTAGQAIELEADGLLSCVLQHEIDHLDGILICDYGPAIPKCSEGLCEES